MEKRVPQQYPERAKADPKGRSKPPQPKEKAKSPAEPPKDQNASAQEIHDAFQVIDPIETCVGPIGRFIPSIEALPKHPSVVSSRGH